MGDREEKVVGIEKGREGVLYTLSHSSVKVKYAVVPADLSTCNSLPRNSNE